MKIYLVAATVGILMAGSAGTASAQQGDIKIKHVALGVKGGLNVYNIHNDNSIEYDPRIGFHLGLLGHIHLNKQFAMQPEIVYSAQGAKYTVSGNEVKLNLDYINIPVMFQYMFDNGFRVQAGPQVGFLMSAKSKTNNASVDIKDDLKKVDFALGIGVGYVRPSTGFGVDARYNFGISNIDKDNSSPKTTNGGFQLGVFYLFNQ